MKVGGMKSEGGGREGIIMTLTIKGTIKGC